MSCGRFTRAAILEHLLSGSSGAPPEMETHLKLCEQCRRDAAALDRLTRIFDALRSQTELKPPDGFFAAVLRECRAILPKVASERRPAIMTAATHGVGTRFFAAVRVEKERRRVLPLVVVSVLIAASVGAAVGALRAGLVTRALVFAEPGGWLETDALAKELSEAKSKARLRALSRDMWRAASEEVYWPQLDLGRLAAFDLARQLALGADLEEARRLCPGLVLSFRVRRPTGASPGEVSLARAWVEAVSLGEVQAARGMAGEGNSRLMMWLRASTALELGEEKEALALFDRGELRGFLPADFAAVYLARRLGDDGRARAAYDRLPTGPAKSSLFRSAE